MPRGKKTEVNNTDEDNIIVSSEISNNINMKQSFTNTSNTSNASKASKASNESIRSNGSNGMNESNGANASKVVKKKGHKNDDNVSDSSDISDYDENESISDAFKYDDNKNKSEDDDEFVKTVVVERVVKYLKLDDVIKEKQAEHRKEMKVIKDAKDQLETFLIEYLDKINQDYIECKGSQLVRTETQTKAPPKMEDISVSLIDGFRKHEIYEDDDEIKKVVKDFMELIEERREIKTRRYIKRLDANKANNADKSATNNAKNTSKNNTKNNIKNTNRNAK